jgi:hypothetical protein
MTSEPIGPSRADGDERQPTRLLEVPFRLNPAAADGILRSACRTGVPSIDA